LDLSKNHFELFGLPEVFSVDLALLAERYRSLQKALHPDRFAAAGDRERRLSLQASTRVNEAYQTLRDQLSRAQYLLALHTGEAGGKNETTRDTAFLMEQMELRDALSAAKDETDLSGVGAVLDRLDELSRTLKGALGASLDDPTAERLAEARELVVKLQFVEKCRVEAEQLEADLEDAL
jgi:molecular chaperone HscB